MKTEHITDQDICLYVDALKLRKTEQLPSDIVAHVADCVECKKQIMQLYDVLKDEDYREIQSHPTFGQEKPTRQEPARLLYRLAAGIVVMLAAGAIAYFALLRNTGEPASSGQAVATDTSGLNTKGNAGRPTAEFAANFTPSPNMEDLVGSDFRAASVTVDSPTNGQAVRGDIAFRWKSPVFQTETPGRKGRSRGTVTFRVRILTNREQEIFQTTTQRNSVVYDKRLDPGLYYWTLQEDGELVHVGKFTVPVP